MIRLYFYVEGQTEQQYAQRVLRGHLAAFGVMVEGALRVSTGRRHGITRRGGGRHYAPMRKDVLRFLRQEHGPDVRVTIMFDLYKIYADFPGMDEADKVKHLPYERVKRLEDALGRDVGDPRLVPHVQLHEFETLLFCELDALGLYFGDCQREIDALRNGAGESLATPELIDDGQESAPSKRIAGQFPDYSALKPGAPVEIASAIGLAVVRAKCPHFNEWLTRLERLNQEAT